MHIFKAVAVTAATLLFAASACATEYKFSYTYSSGVVVSGAFEGSHIGNIVTASSLIGYPSITGPGLNAPIYLYTNTLEHFNAISGQREAGGAIFSFDGLDNSFILTDFPVGSPGIYDEDMVFYGWGNRQNSTIGVSLYRIGSPFDGGAGTWEYATGSDIPNHWVLTVPEPETYALMLAGLGLMGAVVRRRKAKQA